MRDSSPGAGPSRPRSSTPSNSTEQKDVEAPVARSSEEAYGNQTSQKHSSPVTLEKEARWDDLVKQSGDHTYAQEQLANKNDVRSRWRRGLHAAKRIQAGDGLYEASNKALDDANSHSHSALDDYGWTDEEKKRILKKRRATFWGSLSFGLGKERDETEVLPFQSKTLEQQHWLEMIDQKHRYGSNLKYYFRAWKESDTRDNFFRWLDKGEGKDLDLEVLPRERLEKETITYLSAEQRLNYLVNIDRDGRLRWSRNGELVDTAAGKWKDAGNGGGIIPDDTYDDSQTAQDSDDSDAASISSDSYSATSDLQENEDTHYVGLDKEKEKGWLQEKAHGITPSGIKKKMLRKTLRRNTWIYACDLRLNFFVGIKKSGAFQHSSFIGGGKVTSAGIIIVKQGLIKSLLPHSGHYRSSIENYRSFISQLEGRGADLSHVKLGKSVLAMWGGLSKYTAVTKGQKDLVTKFRRTIGLSHEPTEQEKSNKLEENAKKEEQERQEKMEAVREAQSNAPTVEAKNEAAKQVMYGAQREQREETKEDTMRGLGDHDDERGV